MSTECSCCNKRGRKPGTRTTEPRALIHSQRYTEAEDKALKLAAGNDINDFIRSAALDRARLMSEQWGPL